MKSGHIFSKEIDSAKIAMEIFTFLKKWGLWKEVQIFTGGKQYTDKEGELHIRDEDYPEKYTTGISEITDCNGELTYADYSNPERLLDMIFEGPLYLLLNYGEYEACIGDTSEEVRHFIIEETSDFQEEVDELTEAYLEGKIGWDPVEYDSYEEWLELNEFNDMPDLIVESEDIKKIPHDFSSKEEYEDFLLKSATIRECKVWSYFEDHMYDGMNLDDETFFDDGEIASHIINEFDELLERYGLWYELGFSWSLTTYRI